MKRLPFLLISSIIFFACKKSSPENPVGVIPVNPDTLHVTAAANYCAGAESLAFVVWQNGTILKEQYWSGTTSTTPLLAASGTKSFNGPMAIIALQEGLISLDEKVSNAILEWQTDPQKKDITYKQLLNQTSGITPGMQGTATSLPSWPEIAAVTMANNPAERFYYGPYHFNIFGYALQRKLNGVITTENYYKAKLFDKLGINITWGIRCADGNPQLGGGAYLSAKDWLTYGRLMYQHGKWNGVQLIDSALLAECFKPTQPQNPAYGLSWWLNQPVSQQLISANGTLQELAPLLNADWAPRDMYFAAGAGKQRLYIIPSKKAIIVRFGTLNSNTLFNDLAFISLILRGY